MRLNSAISQSPWVQPDKASAEEIAAMIRTCPSGALAYEWPVAEEAPAGINRVSVLENGPLAVAGAIEVDDHEPEKRVTLCRCGLSKNKPYCDYSHVEGGFEASGEPKPKTPPLAKGRGGTLGVKSLSDGPFQVQGHVEITTGTGAHIATMEKAYLCRCGALKNKPFCDGAHKDIEFKA